MERLAKLFGVAEEVAYTCETAAHFWLLHVLARWEKFLAQCAARGRSADSVTELFPFKVRVLPVPGGVPQCPCPCWFAWLAWQGLSVCLPACLSVRLGLRVWERAVAHVLTCSVRMRAVWGAAAWT